jgi:hypothetical protein
MWRNGAEVAVPEETFLRQLTMILKLRVRETFTDALGLLAITLHYIVPRLNIAFRPLVHRALRY